MLERDAEAVGAVLVLVLFCIQFIESYEDINRKTTNTTILIPGSSSPVLIFWLQWLPPRDCKKDSNSIVDALS